MFFIFFKDSEYPVIKELSYIALALSAGIKLYPAIFGLSLIIDILDPQAIVIGGIFTRSRELLWQYAREEIAKEALLASQESE